MKKGIFVVIFIAITLICIKMIQHDSMKKPINNIAYTVQKDILYTDPALLPQTLDLYKSINHDRPSPALIFVHGGSWKQGSKELNKRWKTIFEEIVKEGYVAISIDYTLYKKNNYSYNDPVRDVKTAINYIYENANKLGIDRSQIGLAGASAGGHLALLTGLKAEIQPKLNYIIAWYPISDLSTMNQSPSSRSIEIVERFMNSTAQQMADEYSRMSPIQYVKHAKIPIFIVHGTGDALVPFSQSEEFTRKNPKMVTLIALEHGNHGFTNLSIQQSTNDTINYLKAKLKK